MRCGNGSAVGVGDRADRSYVCDSSVSASSGTAIAAESKIAHGPRSVVFGEFGEATVDGLFGFANEFGYLGFG